MDRVQMRVSAPLPSCLQHMPVRRLLPHVGRYCGASGETLQYIAQVFAGDSNWRRLFNMNTLLADPDLIFTDNRRLVVGNM